MQYSEAGVPSASVPRLLKAASIGMPQLWHLAFSSILCSWIYPYGCSVCKNLGRPLRKFRRVVPHPNDRVGSYLVGVLDHSIKSLHARLFTDDRPFLDVAAHNGFQTADNTTPDACRPDDDPAHDAEILDDLSSLDFDSCCYDHKPPESVART